MKIFATTVAAALIAAAIPAAQAQDSGAAGKPTTASKPAAAPAKKAAAPAAAGAAKTGDAKGQTSYSIGVSMGTQLHGAGIDADMVTVDRIAAGIHDALAGKAKMSDADQEAIGNMIRTARTAQVDKNHTAAAAFLAANGKKPDIVTTASGLEYKVIAAGNGNSPAPTDEVSVQYRGKLLDGTEFDSSYAHGGQPVTFPVNGVIPGWTEALQLMKPGAKFQVFIPPKLAYDVNSPSPVIPPGSMLVFDVELVSVKAGKAAPAVPMPHPNAPATTK
ncbi:MAG TPA: FKBP-type peptidyl-prolyl cis-trans isomerase [Steroidobacteraceae bacterium]|jgi:FKBP-type peptidyl-prolyl cis-trans isomerase FklB